jgi:hypothetical protein
MRTSLAFVVASLVACGGPAKGPEEPSGGGGTGGGAPSKPMGPGDVAFEIQPQEIKGTLWEPEALGLPGMALTEAKKKTTLDKQRQAYEKASKGKDSVMRQAQAAILATMLYLEAKKLKGDEQTKLYTEARQVLRDSITAAGEGKADETTLRMLGAYEFLLGDYAGAEKAFAALVKQAPKDKEVQANKAWLGYALLKQFKNAEAMAVVGGEQVSEKQPELAYVIGWTKWRSGDTAGGLDALLTATKGWGTIPGRDTLDNELMMLSGRSNATLDATLASLTPLFGKSTDQQYALLSKLGLTAYFQAGRWADGVAVLDKAIATAGPKVPVNDRPAIRYTQADYTVRLDDPVTAAKFAKEAIEALAACGTKCSDKDKNAIVQYVFLMARLFHVVYATSHDDRYYQPAHDLYALVVPKLVFDDTLRKEGQAGADTLEKTFKAMKAGVGTHDKGAVGALLSRHNQEVTVCYENALSQNPKLGGTLTLNLESDQTGAIKGVSTEPRAGAEGMSAVAGCVAERAKSWNLSKRAQAGNTRVKATYSLSVAKK